MEAGALVPLPAVQNKRAEISLLQHLQTVTRTGLGQRCQRQAVPGAGPSALAPAPCCSLIPESQLSQLPAQGPEQSLGSSRNCPKEHFSFQTECVSLRGQRSSKTQEKGNTEGRTCEGKRDWKFGILQLKTSFLWESSMAAAPALLASGCFLDHHEQGLGSTPSQDPQQQVLLLPKDLGG